MASTVENLKVAFAGESQANRKYLAFAKKAEKEGLGQIAKLFRAAAEAETIHAHAHLQNMGGVGSTLENLREAISGETHEFTEMYPPMVAQAIAEQHKAKTMLEWATGVERPRQPVQAGARGARVRPGSLADGRLPVPRLRRRRVRRSAGEVPVCGAAGAKYQKVG